MRGLTVVLFFVCVIIYIHLGSALQCYDCNATLGQNDDCEVAYKKVKTVDCSFFNSACYIFMSNDGIIRSCLVKDTCMILKDRYKHCSTCEDDLCNSGFVLNCSTSLGLAFVLFILVKSFM